MGYPEKGPGEASCREGLNRKEEDRMVTKMVIGMIRGYQRWISPHKGSSCRFYPTCSAYSLTAYERYGFWKGTWLTLRRIMKCHPFHSGGVDYVPEEKVESKNK